MTLEQIRRRAQLTADGEGKAVAILNLNCFSPLYVIRAWDDRFVGDRQLVERVDPKAEG